ncbi:MAG TPA: cytochrome c [Gemmatimonadaceae bacterium]|jgi:mono/diheme cytochrome c family protein
MTRIAMTIVVFAVACGGRPDSRELRDFERMRVQKRYDSYDASRRFPNGATMQVPPANTVSREADLSHGDGSMPTSSAHALALGARQYAISCAVCHGAAGYGGGRLAPNLTEHRPASLRGTAIVSTTPAALFETITNGEGGMPALGWQLSPAQRWAVIAYVRSLSTLTPTGQAAADARADSAMARYLHEIDSLQANGAPIAAIARVPRPLFESPR